MADDGAGEGAGNRLWTADLLARVGEKVGPVSTFVNGFAMNAMMLEAIAELVRRGIEPSISRSSNSPGGDEANIAVMVRDTPPCQGTLTDEGAGRPCHPRTT